MDPISTAIIAAIASGLTQGSIADAYKGIKHLILSTYGNKDMKDAIEKLEQKPDSRARQLELQDQVESCNLVKDEKILEYANLFLEKIQPSGHERHIQTARGNNIVQADHGSSVNITIG